MSGTTGLPAEERLLIALAKPYANDADLTEGRQALSTPDFNWLEAMRLARAHWVSPMLAWNLRADESVFRRLPDTVRAELSLSLGIASHRRSRYHAALEPVFDELLFKAVPFALMKGAVLMETVYPPSTRLLNDLDILVPKAYRSMATDTLKKSGFRPADKVPDLNYHELSLVKAIGGTLLCIDLHWDVYPRDDSLNSRPFHFDVHEVLARARPQNFGRLQVLGMSPEDTFVHCATQLLNDDFRHAFLRVCDLYGLVSAGLDSNRLVSIASTTGAAGIAHTALKVLGLLGTSSPSSLLNRLTQLSPSCGVPSDFLTDPRWLFERRRIAAGTVNFMRLLYMSDPHQRRRYCRLLPRRLYASERGCGHSVAAALLQTVRALVSTLICAGLLQIIAAGSIAGHKRLRTLLWRKWER